MVSSLDTSSTSRKVERMTARIHVVFGVPVDCSEARIRAAAQQLYYIPDRQPLQFVMRLSPAAGRDGHHWFTFIGAPGRSYLLERWLESLYQDLRTAIDVVIHQGRREPPRARRFTSHFANEPLAVDPAYLGALSSKLALNVAERDQTVKQRRMAPSLAGLRNPLDMDVAQHRGSPDARGFAEQQLARVERHPWPVRRLRGPTGAPSGSRGGGSPRPHVQRP